MDLPGVRRGAPIDQEAYNFWMLDGLNLRLNDEFADLFPGIGKVEIQKQPSIFIAGQQLMKPYRYPSEIKRIAAKSAERAKTHDRVLALLDSKEGIETSVIADLAMMGRYQTAALLCWLERQGKVSRTLDWTNKRRDPYSFWVKIV